MSEIAAIGNVSRNAFTAVSKSAWVEAVNVLIWNCTHAHHLTLIFVIWIVTDRRGFSPLYVFSLVDCTFPMA